MTPKELAEAYLAAITATVQEDKMSAEAAVKDITSKSSPKDIAETGVGLATMLVLMEGRDQDMVLQALAQWVAET